MAKVRGDSEKAIPSTLGPRRLASVPRLTPVGDSLWPRDYCILPGSAGVTASPSTGTGTGTRCLSLRGAHTVLGGGVPTKGAGLLRMFLREQCPASRPSVSGTPQSGVRVNHTTPHP